MSIPRRRWGRGVLPAVLTVVAALAAVSFAATRAPADTGASCSAAYTIAWQTPSNSPPDFGVTVTVTNNSSYAITGWTVTWTFTAGQSLVAGTPYSAVVVQAGSAVTATPETGYNANLSPGASTTFGFNGDYNGTSNPVPAVTCSGPSQGTSSAALSGSLDPLGVNTASWDTNSKLAVTGAMVGTLAVATPNIYGYYSQRSGTYNVMLVNADPSNSYTVTASSLGITSSSETRYTYDAASPAIVSATQSGGSVSVPAESIVVLAGGTGGPPAPSPTPTATPTPTGSPTPTPTPSPTPTPTPTPTPSGGCAVSVSVANSWSGGFQLGITVTNSGSTATTGWTAGFTWPGSQTISQIWGATSSQSGSAVTMTNVSYDGAIPAGGSTTFGLLGTGSAPASFTGLRCSPT